MNKITADSARLLTEVRKNVPLIHNITNYVTVNDCANAILAIGASPIMADDINEVDEITSISSALVINIGTLNERTVNSILKAGKKANTLGIPVIFDPVGAGASSFRNETTNTILDEIKISVLRGNLSEISFASGLKASTRGVDASEADVDNDSTSTAKSAAKKYDCIAAVTGAIDVISDGSRVAYISNGHNMLSRVTGTGCMTTAIIGAYCGVTKDYFTSAIIGVASMGICGELAFENAGNSGTGSFHTAIIDAISRLNENIILERAKINEA